jgi:hypothetical protein
MEDNIDEEYEDNFDDALYSNEAENVGEGDE